MLKIAVVQFNPVVGALAANAGRMLEIIEAAQGDDPAIIVFPECALTGYPLEDLILRQSFMTETNRVRDGFIDELIRRNYRSAVIFGSPAMVGNMVTNNAYMVDPLSQPTVQVNKKIELPNYGVFDEKRVFRAGAVSKGFHFRGRCIGVPICEDIWFPRACKELQVDGAELIIAINGSPYEVGKNVTRRQIVANRIKETGLPFVYVNMVGGQDELVFDGGSFAYDGKKVHEAPHFREGVFTFELDFPSSRGAVTLDNYRSFKANAIESIYRACVLGLRDYLGKLGVRSVALGYSGGVDSGLVAAIACDAIGPDNVNLVRLPSKYSSEGSLTDAEEGALRLGAPFRTIHIEDVVQALRDAYKHASYGSERTGNFPFPTADPSRVLTGVADENIQARARGTIMMAISNQEGHMVLTTGNKSEVSVGYSTLYGDMAGGFNPIKDCYKTTVWAMCRWRNKLGQHDLDKFGFKGRVAEVVPEAIITKPPSAELRPDQKDEDSLPPYDVLDTILKSLNEHKMSAAEATNWLLQAIGNGWVARPAALRQFGDNDLYVGRWATETVEKVRRLLVLAEYKRRQAAPGIKITKSIFGRDWRYPIINAWDK